METPRPIREFVGFGLCLGELAIWAVQDALIAVDNAIVELPDY